MSYLRIQTFCQIYNKKIFFVVSSSYFFSNTMACSIVETKPWCWFIEELLRISCHVFTGSLAPLAGELISSSARDGGCSRRSIGKRSKRAEPSCLIKTYKLYLDRCRTIRISWTPMYVSKLPAKKPAVSLGLAEKWTSSTRHTVVGRSELIVTSVSCMEPIPYFKMSKRTFPQIDNPENFWHVKTFKYYFYYHQDECFERSCVEGPLGP